jgi:hypothetical protein
LEQADFGGGRFLDLGGGCLFSGRWQGAVGVTLGDNASGPGGIGLGFGECFGGGSIPFDAHGTELRMKVVVTSDESTEHTMTVSTTESRIQIWSAGEDQTWDTEDDELLIDGESSTKTTKTESTTTISPEAGENR